jgi:hypothetical protein
VILPAKPTDKSTDEPLPLKILLPNLQKEATEAVFATY